jgi:GNAT superfamily N-acetyltransferase
MTGREIMNKEYTGKSADIGESVAFRPVGPDDDDLLLGIYASTREEELAQTDWNTDQKMSFLRWQLQMQRQDYDARFPNADYRIILFEGVPAGRLWIARTPEQIRLLDIAILPEYQNRRIGTFILSNLISESEDVGKPLRHMIFKLNTGARRFYERLGFRLKEDERMYLLMERHPAGGEETAI